MQPSLAEQLIETYNMLDIYMREKLRVGSRMGHTDMLRAMAKRKEVFSKHEPELVAFAKLRNLIVHNVYPHEAEPFAEPHEFAVKQYGQLVKQIVDPPLALSIAVKGYDIYITSLDSSALGVMKTMNEKFYNYVPVIEADTMIGIFSENTVFAYIAEKGRCIDEGTKIKEFAQYLPLNKHKNEYFKFVDKDASVTDVEELFKIDMDVAKRLAVVYITRNGEPGEKLLGMITAWDLAGR